MEAHQFGPYLRRAGAIIAAGAAACVALVVLVDPYRLYGIVEQPGFNQVKPQPDRLQKHIKLAGARATGANLFIVGNSRAEIGLDPAWPGLAGGGLSPYNLALAGTGIQTAREQLDHLAAAGQHPKHIIAGVEFLDFPLNPDLVQGSADSPAASPLADYTWRFDAIFSLDSLWDAVRTVRLQDAADPDSMTALGFNPLFEYRKLARNEGYHALFAQRANDYAKRFARMPDSLVDPRTGSSRSFDELQKVIEMGARRKAVIDVVIYPYHAQIMALLDANGKTPLFEQWKAMMAARVDAMRAAHPAAQITLWDFSGYSPYQCEAVPAKGDRRAQTKWYWEAGHFKADLGNIMLAQVLDQPAMAPGAGFGMRLDPASLETNRRRIAAERARCMQANPALFADMAALAARVAR